MKKRLLAAILATMMLMSGCGADDKDSAKKDDTTTTTTASADNGDNADSKDEIPAGTPYAEHGALAVNGADLVDASGEKFQLYGMSTHGIAWFPDYVNYDTFKFLRDEWGTNCIRLAMYTHESGGYGSDGDKEALKTLVKNGVDYASELGMYVIIDWHVLNEKSPMVYLEESKAFFEEMSSLYKDKDNVIYEICNEPNGTADWKTIKNYANEIIPIIRNNDPNSIIICGTPTWSQDIDKAERDRLEYDNVMYALHFYAATHKEWLRSRLENCYYEGLPIFISEFGICDASGNGAVDIVQADAWKEMIEKYNISYMCWNLANKNEASSIIETDCDKLYGWTDDELKTEGKWISEWFKSEQ